MSRKQRRMRAVRQWTESLEARRLLTTYFVDNATGDNGSDSNAGTTLSAPFLTISRAASLAVPGDVVDILAGTYRETVTPAYSGVAGAPITYQAYDNQNVVINGANIVGNWSSYSGNIYQSAVMNWTMGGQNDQVFEDGQMINYARWPNTSLDVSHPSLAFAGPNSTGTTNSNGFIVNTIHDPNLTQPAGYWNGATIHIAPGANWVYETATITNYTPGVITYTSSFNSPQFYTVQPGNPYYITGDPGFSNGGFQTLDSAGSFYRDPNTGKLYLWTTGGDSPANHVIEAKARTWGFDLSGLQYININGISLFGCGIQSTSYSGHLLINGINAKYVSHFETYNGAWTATLSNGTPVVGGTGIVLNGGNNTLENSTIAYSAGDGVSVWGNNNTVYNNVIHDVDYAGVNCSGIDSTEYTGVTASNNSISYNTVYDGARALIDASDLSASRVDYNRVYNAMEQADDGAAIYAYGIVGNGTEIDHNLVYNTVNEIPGYASNGIFLDVGSTGVTIDHNVVYNVTQGIKNFETNTNSILNNTIAYTSDAVDLYYPTGGTVANNLCSAPLVTNGVPSGDTVQTNLFSSTLAQFVSPSTGNFQLLPSSAAINAGTVVAPYTNGYVGSAPDIGAYEYGGAVPTYGASNTAAALAAIAVPSPWSATDIGSPSLPGNTMDVNGVFDVTGSGSDIWGSADQFQFASTAVSGDQTMVARVVSQTNTNVWAKAGVMFRSTSAANSPFIAVVDTPGEGINLLSRSASGGLAVTQSAAIAYPVWIKLVRSSNVFTGYDSVDGVNWNTIGSITIVLPTAGLIGLAVTSCDNTQLSTATFDNVSVALPAPTGLTATSVSNSQISLTWNAIAGATGYQLQRCTDGVNFVTVATLGTVTSYSDTTLQAGVQYSYRLISAGVLGLSGPSAISSVSTLTLAPSSLTAVAGLGQVALSWAAVSGAVTYNIYRGTTAGGESATALATGIKTNSVTDSSTSTAGVTYYYTVSAVNSNISPLNSESVKSAEVSATIVTVPAQPAPQFSDPDFSGVTISAGAYVIAPTTPKWTFTGAAGIQSNGSALYAAAAPVGTQSAFIYGSSPAPTINQSIAFYAAGQYMITLQAAQRFPGGGVEPIAVDVDGNLIATISPVSTAWTSFSTASFAITAGTHVFSFAGTSANGAFSFIDSVGLVTVNASATGLAVTSVASSQVNLTWTAAASATGYQVQRSTDGINFSTVATLGAVTSYSDSSGLAAGTRYSYRVIATNATGSSAPSGSVTASTLTLAPGTATANAGAGQIVLAWSATLGAVAYNIYRGTAPGAEGTTPIASGITSLTYTDNTVSSGTTFYYAVAAVNANPPPLNSESGRSVEVSATAITAAPAVPSGVTVKATVGLITLTWTASRNATSYNIYRGTASGAESTSPYATGITTVSFTDSSVVSNTTYYYYVTASAPESAPSIEVSATPLTPLAPPTGLNASISFSSITLNWAATARAVSYNVYRGTTSGGESATPIGTGITTPSYVDSSVVWGNQYYYVVTASSPESAASTEITAIAGATTVPGLIQAENYNYGGQGVGYSSPTTTNQGGAYRNDGIGIENTSDVGGGYDVGYTTAGEWLNYTITVPTTGYYTFSTRVASPLSGGAFHIGIDGVNVTGTMTVPTTGGWQTWTTVTSGAVQLAGGTHVMRLSMDAGNPWVGNFNYINVSAVAAPAPSAPSGLTGVVSDGAVALSWTANTNDYAFNVYRGTTAGHESVTPLASGLTGTTYLDTTAVLNTTYYYYVIATGLTGSPVASPASNEVSASTTVMKLTGQPIGTQTSYLNSGDTIQQVFDGNFNSYFDAPNNSLANWVGLDLGSAKNITTIKYAPRAGDEFRMYDAMFQVSNTPDFSSGVETIYTISAIPTAGQFTTVNVTPGGAYRYVRYLGGTQWVNIAEMEVDGTN